LSSLGHDVTGYALDSAPALASAISGAKFVVSQELDPKALPFRDDAFGAVLSVGVLEHVRETGGDELASLREIARLLKPSGVFICYHLPNRYSYLEALAGLIPSAHRHTYRFTERDIRSLCSSAGFDITEIHRYGALPRNPWQSVGLSIANSPWFADIWDRLDSIGASIVPAIVQNYCFVARAR
jgi:SAM-dependent methyltransferase